MSCRTPALFLFCIAAMAIFVSGPALADARQDVQAGIARCAGFADDRQFLDCVYGAAQPLRAQLGLPPAPASQIRLVPPPAGTRPMLPTSIQPSPAPSAQLAIVKPPPPAPPQPRGGFFTRLVGGGAHPVLHIASYTFDKHGMFTVTLSDGEILRQADNDIHYAHWRGAPPRGNVTVVDGSFGGQTLVLDGESDPYLIVRLR